MQRRSFTASDTIVIAPTMSGALLLLHAAYDFTVSPAADASSISPAEPASIEDVTVSLSLAGVTVNAPGWLYDWLCDSRDDWLMQQAAAQHEAAADDAADHRRDLLREDV